MKKTGIFLTVFLTIITVLTSVTVFADTSVPILLYHNMLKSYDEKDSIVTITPERFEEHIISLKKNGYTPVSFDDYLDAANGRSSLPEKPVIITFDDGYETNYTYMYPIAVKYNIPVTIFVVAKTVGQTPGAYPHFTWEQAKIMSDSGLISIQSHTFSHESVTGKTDFDAEREIRYSKYLIEKNLGTKCNVLSFPYGFHTAEHIFMSKRAGYDLSVQVGNFGKNTLNDADKALIRITVYGSWSGDDLLNRIDYYENQ